MSLPPRKSSGPLRLSGAEARYDEAGGVRVRLWGQVTAPVLEELARELEAVAPSRPRPAAMIDAMECHKLSGDARTALTACLGTLRRAGSRRVVVAAWEDGARLLVTACAFAAGLPLTLSYTAYEAAHVYAAACEEK